MDRGGSRLAGGDDISGGILSQLVGHTHGCCWDTFYMFAYCGLEVEISLNC